MFGILLSCAGGVGGLSEGGNTVIVRCPSKISDMEAPEVAVPLMRVVQGLRSAARYFEVSAPEIAVVVMGDQGWGCEKALAPFKMCLLLVSSLQSCPDCGWQSGDRVPKITSWKAESSMSALKVVRRAAGGCDSAGRAHSGRCGYR